MTSSKMTSPKQWSLPPWSVCGLLILLLLTACSPGQGSSSSTPTVRPQPTQQPSPGSSPVAQQPTQQPSPGPSPVATLLAQAPKDCPLGPSLDSKVFSQFKGAPATGSGPVWESGLPPNAHGMRNELHICLKCLHRGIQCHRMCLGSGQKSLCLPRTRTSERMLSS